MRVFHCDEFPVELPEGHRFPMGKYGRLRARLVEEGLLTGDSIVAARPAAVDDVLAVHDAAYVFALLEGTLDRRAVQRIGFPWSEALVLRSLASVGATLGALDEALRRTPDAAGRAPTGIGGALAGGTHHAHRDFGAGYCVFNDLAVAAQRALDTGRARRVLVFDVDVHQGDGTAAIFAGEPRVFTARTLKYGARHNFSPPQQNLWCVGGSGSLPRAW
jgi:acetoin utilization deacetylase AcuC-like enzyme